MDKDEALRSCVWDEFDRGELTLPSIFFDKEVLVMLSPYFGSGKRLSDKMMECLNDFLCLSQVHLGKVKALLYNNCDQAFDLNHYDHVAVRQGESTCDATARTFGIYNAEDAYKQSNIEMVIIDERNDRYRNRYVELLFYPTWEEEGCSVILRNGIPVGWQETMDSMQKYEI